MDEIPLKTKEDYQKPRLGTVQVQAEWLKPRRGTEVCLLLQVRIIPMISWKIASSPRGGTEDFVVPSGQLQHPATTPASLQTHHGFEAMDLAHQSQLPSDDIGSVIEPKSISHADAMTGSAGDPSVGKEFFGHSSAGSFIRQVHSVIDRRAVDLGDRIQPHDLREDKMQDSQLVDHRDYILPPRRYADSLLTAYYDLVWAVFPILDRTVIQKAYEGCWLGSHCAIPEHILYSLVNLIFALGSQFSEVVEPSRRKETGLSFWNRARQLYRHNPHDASLERVQCLLLMGLYLQSTSDTYECWMAIGSATRMAQSLGLHSDALSTKLLGPRQHQIACRVWHGCVYQDRCVLFRGRMSCNAEHKLWS